MTINEIQPLIAKIADGGDLNQDEAARAFQIMMNNGATPAQIAGFLVALKVKGEVVDEITGAAMALRKKMQSFTLDEAVRLSIVDTCGTGGDSKGTYNISTTVAFVVAGAGIPVVKHGNKAISSKSGSADVLSELGVKIDVGEAVMQTALEEAGICFLMAPRYHPAMRYVAPVRLELGMRTIFNLLGPLINPAQPVRQLMGVYDKRWVEPIAKVLHSLGSKRAFVVHGEDGLDELTLVGKSYVSELLNDDVKSYTIHPEQFGLEALEDHAPLVGGDPKENAQELRAVLKGKEGPYRDMVLLNAGAAIAASDDEMTIERGIEAARASIESGKALAALEGLVSVTNRDG